MLTNFNPQEGDGGATPSHQKRFHTKNITYAKAATPTPSLPPSQASLSTLTDIDKLYDSMSARFGEQFRLKVSINDLEKQVERTSTEILNIRNNFETQLTSIQTLVDQLTSKVNAQYVEINSTVQSLVDTIAKQNFIIAGILN